ncbi:MAG: sensor histidine kinase [Actinomycetota bacterium]
MTTEPEMFQPPGFPRSRVALPALVAFVQVIGTAVAAGHEPARRPLDLLAFVLLGAGPGALVLRRTYPVAVLLFTFAITSVYELLGYADGPVFFAVAVAVVAATMQGHRRAAILVTALGYGVFVWGEFALGLGPAPETPEAVAVGAWLVALLTIAEVVRVRRERFQEAMRTRAEERKRRASEERLRIAQELHDVLAHNISLINVQAGVALHLLDEQPERARPALSAIKEASNAALGELRSVLDVLRRDSDAAPRAPTPGIAQLGPLIARTESAGLTVVMHTQGEPRPLPVAVDQAAFRIVQESLTNVTRHAGAAAVRIELTYGPDDLTIEVHDDGRGTPTQQGTGKGVAGMTERALALGGDLRAEPAPDGGFVVRARLPYGADEGGEAG